MHVSAMKQRRKKQNRLRTILYETLESRQLLSGTPVSAALYESAEASEEAAAEELSEAELEAEAALAAAEEAKRKQEASEGETDESSEDEEDSEEGDEEEDEEGDADSAQRDESDEESDEDESDASEEDDSDDEKSSEESDGDRADDDDEDDEPESQSDERSGEQDDASESEDESEEDDDAGEDDGQSGQRRGDADEESGGGDEDEEDVAEDDGEQGDGSNRELSDRSEDDDRTSGRTDRNDGEDSSHQDGGGQNEAVRSSFDDQDSEQDDSRVGRPANRDTADPDNQQQAAPQTAAKQNGNVATQSRNAETNGPRNTAADPPSDTGSASGGSEGAVANSGDSSSESQSYGRNSAQSSEADDRNRGQQSDSALSSLPPGLQDGLPPGLAKRDTLPPGLQKRIDAADGNDAEDGGRSDRAADDSRAESQSVPETVAFESDRNAEESNDDDKDVPDRRTSLVSENESESEQLLESEGSRNTFIEKVGGVIKDTVEAVGDAVKDAVDSFVSLFSSSPSESEGSEPERGAVARVDNDGTPAAEVQTPQDSSSGERFDEVVFTSRSAEQTVGSGQEFGTDDDLPTFESAEFLGNPVDAEELPAYSTAQQIPVERSGLASGEGSPGADQSTVEYDSTRTDPFAEVQSNASTRLTSTQSESNQPADTAATQQPEEQNSLPQNGQSQSYARAEQTLSSEDRRVVPESAADLEAEAREIGAQLVNEVRTVLEDGLEEIVSILREEFEGSPNAQATESFEARAAESVPAPGSEATETVQLAPAQTETPTTLGELESSGKVATDTLANADSTLASERSNVPGGVALTTRLTEGASPQQDGPESLPSSVQPEDQRGAAEDSRQIVALDSSASDVSAQVAAGEAKATDPSLSPTSGVNAATPGAASVERGGKRIDVGSDETSSPPAQPLQVGVLNELPQKSEVREVDEDVALFESAATDASGEQSGSVEAGEELAPFSTASSINSVEPGNPEVGGASTAAGKGTPASKASNGLASVGVSSEANESQTPVKLTASGIAAQRGGASVDAPDSILPSQESGTDEVKVSQPALPTSDAAVGQERVGGKVTDSERTTKPDNEQLLPATEVNELMKRADGARALVSVDNTPVKAKGDETIRAESEQRLPNRTIEIADDVRTLPAVVDGKLAISSEVETESKVAEPIEAQGKEKLRVRSTADQQTEVLKTTDGDSVAESPKQSEPQLASDKDSRKAKPPANEALEVEAQGWLTLARESEGLEDSDANAESSAFEAPARTPAVELLVVDAAPQESTNDTRAERSEQEQDTLTSDKLVSRETSERLGLGNSLIAPIQSEPAIFVVDDALIGDGQRLTQSLKTQAIHATAEPEVNLDRTIAEEPAAAETLTSPMNGGEAEGQADPSGAMCAESGDNATGGEEQSSGPSDIGVWATAWASFRLLAREKRDAQSNVTDRTEKRDAHPRIDSRLKGDG